MENTNTPFNEVAYVHTDLDGAGCTILYKLAHLYDKESDETWRLFNVDNDRINEVVLNDLNSGKLKHTTKIMFADICVKKHVLTQLKKRGIEDVTILDHHKTNLPALDVYPDSTIWVPKDNTEPLQSGTSLMYDYYRNLYGNDAGGQFPFNDVQMNSNLAIFVDIIRSYDTYEWKETGDIAAKELQVLFQLLGMERFCKRYINKFSNPFCDDNHIISENDMEFVSRKIELEETTIEEFSPNDVYDISYNKKLGALALGTRGANINELANSFLTKNPEYDFMVSFDLSRTPAFSFRAVKDDIDLGKDFAGQIGGGGHPKAAGAFVKPDLIDRIVDMLYDYLSEHGRIQYGK